MKYAANARRNHRRKKMLLQKLLGFILLALCVLYWLYAANCASTAVCDGSALLIAVPLGAFLVLTRKVVIT